MAKGKNYYKKKDLRAARAASNSTRSGYAEESSEAATAQSTTSTAHENIGSDDAGSSQYGEDETDQASEGSVTRDVWSEDDGDVSDGASPGRSLENSPAGETRREIGAGVEEGTVGEHASCHSQQQENNAAGESIEALEFSEDLVVSTEAGSSQEEPLESDHVSGGGDMLGVGSHTVINDAAVACRGGDEENGQASNNNNNNTTAHAGSSLAPLPVSSPSQPRPPTPDKRKPRLPTDIDLRYISKAIIQIIKAESPRLLGYTMLLTHSVFRKSMDTVDLLHKLLRTIRRCCKTTTKQLRSIERLIKQVARDAREERERRGEDIEGSYLPGLPGNSQSWEGPPSINFTEPLCGAITTSNEQTTQPLPVNREIPRSISTFTTVHPRPPALESRMFDRHRFYHGNLSILGIASSRHDSSISPFPFGVARYHYRRSLLRSPIQRRPRGNHQQYNHQALEEAVTSAAESEKVAPPPLPRPQLKEDSFKRRLTITGPEIDMLDEPVLTFNELTHLHLSVYNHITEAWKAENRMINHEIMVPAPPGGLQGLVALRGKHAKETLEHLIDAKKHEATLPADWMEKPFEEFMEGQDRMGRERTRGTRGCERSLKELAVIIWVYVLTIMKSGDAYGTCVHWHQPSYWRGERVGLRAPWTGSS